MKHLITILFAVLLITLTGCDDTGSVTSVDDPATIELTQEQIDSLDARGCTVTPSMDLETFQELNPEVVFISGDTLEYDLTQCGVHEPITTIESSSSSDISSSSSDISSSSVINNVEDIIMIDITDSTIADTIWSTLTDGTFMETDTTVMVVHNGLSQPPYYSGLDVLNGYLLSGYDVQHDVTMLHNLYIHMDRTYLIEHDEDVKEIELTVNRLMSHEFNDDNRIYDELTFYIGIGNKQSFDTDATLRLLVNGFSEFNYDMHISYNNGITVDRQIYAKFTLPLKHVTRNGSTLTGMDLLDGNTLNEIRLTFTNPTIENAVLDFQLLAVTLN